MSITEKQLEKLNDYLSDLVIFDIEGGIFDKEWLMSHITLKFDDVTKTVVIEIWDMNEQDYNELKC